MSIEKWLPQHDKAVQEYVYNCKRLYDLAEQLENRLGYMLCDRDDAWLQLQETSVNLDVIGKLFVKVSGDHRAAVKGNFRCNHWRKAMNNKRLSVIYLANQVINCAFDRFLQEKSHLSHILKLVVFFDIILPLASGSESESTSIVRNSCPLMMLPLRRLSLTKILQIIAQTRAEHCGQQLVFSLINIKEEIDRRETRDAATSDSGDSVSSNSSIEVYKALVQNLSPAHVGTVTAPTDSSGVVVDKPRLIVSEVALLESLVAVECLNLKFLLEVIARETPDRLGPPGSCRGPSSKGEYKPIPQVRRKILDYYQEILWGLVGTYAEYALIWRGIGFYGDVCTKWSSWLKKFVSNVSLPTILKPALQSLVDGLTVHVATVNWDYSFRRALVAAGWQNSTHLADDHENGTKVGLLFTEMLSELVSLSNSCEGSNWTVAALEELPLSEQIPILHRLDHSVHTARLWAEGKARQLSNLWAMDQFFRVTQVDVNQCMLALDKRHFASQVDLLGPDCSVHTIVCGKMRAKITSEVNANVSQLQQVPRQSIDVLAAVGRVFSLANLKLMFPEPKYWKQNFDEIPQYASGYVEDYLDVVLKPVIQATTILESSVQQRVSCLVLDIMCEAWLDHIYKSKVKFSEWGALQLLADFGAVPTWLLERVNATPNLLCTEMLRRCEGVGRLLLSQPGHRVPMVDKTVRSYQGENAEGSPQRMPPEMYVPNQSQWLELRAPKQNMFSLCCPLNLVRLTEEVGEECVK